MSDESVNNSANNPVSGEANAAGSEVEGESRVLEPASSRTMTTLGRTLVSVVDVGRELLARRRKSETSAEAARTAAGLGALCKDLIEHRGEASGLALASEIVLAYEQLDDEQCFEFFQSLAMQFDVDSEAILAAAQRYQESPELEQLWALNRVVEAPRQKLFRRLNTAPGGTRALVAMRGRLLKVLPDNPHFRGIDSDLRHLFISWFNKGFLELRRIDWSSPASVLEKIIDYEAVHEINGWDDLRSRLNDDRRCFAFFHPALKDDPLVFVEIALTHGVPDSLAPLLVQDREASPDHTFNTVVFYSISNCHPGLASVSFGNFLIKAVVEELRKEFAGLKTFVTLSPVPGFRKWLLKDDLEGLIEGDLVERVRQPVGRVVEAEVMSALQKLCAHYLLNVKSGRLPKDPVARFHLGNGAILHQLNVAADLSPKGIAQSAGIMVNYLYDLQQIEANHDAYFDEGVIAAGKSVKKLAE
ncbi:MAG: malonyl-CoA decarboxylase [Halioglobus sp.]